MSFIECKNLYYQYNSSKRNAINNVDLNIEQGEFIAVIGHNGSGKSTFAKLLNGLLQPSGGSVLVGGISTADEAKRIELLQSVGMIFQNPDNQIVASIVEEDVAFGPENLGVPQEELRSRVDDALKTVGMYEQRLKAPHNLSGGQKQRVAIAGIIAMQPKCIIMDEATAMLDPIGRKEVMEAVRKLNREFGITIIYITHFMNEAVDADRVILLDSGEVVKDGTPHEVFADYDTMMAYGLDVPQGYQLMHQLGIDACVLTEKECVAQLENLLGENGKTRT
ncbi:MAG: energy-coupling factor transporter ATPase [Ruminococcaceae bacterium]|nr:energy-coupling factor transporter ATPase [Oscillospiraceae bacterium]